MTRFKAYTKTNQIEISVSCELKVNRLSLSGMEISSQFQSDIYMKTDK